MSSNRFILAATCILVKGFKRTILADLHRSNFWVFDNPIKSWLTGINESEISSLSKEDLSLFNELNKEEVFIRIPAYLQDSFTDLPMNFYNSTILNNCILELSKLTVDRIEHIIYSLNRLGCKFVEIRCNDDIDFNTILLTLKKFETSTIECLDLLIKYEKKITPEKIDYLRDNIFELRWIYIYSTPNDLLSKLNHGLHKSKFISQNIDSTNCGNISTFYFSINTSSFTEAKNYNSCLNCKVSISHNGDIKNCPSMQKGYGNIISDNLEDVVTMPDFQSLGKIKKDEIKVCKDCEFRYICTDCRAFVENPDDIYSKPLKCGYDPYTGQWKEWSTNPLKFKTIKQYGLQ